MKKSQVLAALALAFALGLGVIAPITSVSAIDHTAPSADCGEVAHVMQVVDENPTYKAMLKLYNDAQKYTGTDNEATVKSAITTAMTNLQTAGVAVSSIPGSSASLVDTKSAAITNVANFDIYDGLYDAIQDPTAANLGSFKLYVEKYNDIQGITPVISDYTWANWTAVVGDTGVITSGSMTGNVISGTWLFRNYTQYAALSAAVDAATDFATGMNALEADLLALGVTQTAIDGTTNPAARAALATSVTGYTDYISGTNSVMAKMTAGRSCSVANEATNAYGYINDIAAALKKADSKTYGGKTVQEVIDILLGTVVTTPTTPTDPTGPNDTNEPGDADNKGDDTTPGNTGVVSSANGTASSTVAVVAGIATALTAAGAGVVAYRNARREA